MPSYNKYLLFVLFIVATLLAGCAHDDVDTYTETPQNVRIHFNISTDPLLNTRAAGSVDGSIAESTTIQDLNIYIWNNLFSYHKYYSSASAANMEVVTGNYNVVAIANAGHDLGEVDTGALSTATLSELGIDAATNPILTFADKVNIASVSTIDLTLKRTYAYVAFNFSIENSFTDCTLLSYRLLNVPSTTTIAPPPDGAYTEAALCTDATEYYPLNGATSAFDKTYVFENYQPDVPSITNGKDRTRDNAPAAATYMELNCRHADGRLFTLRFYLGDGSPSSFTLKRNTRTQYNITIYSENDARVTSIEAAYSPITQQIIASGTGAGFYDLGTASYTATDAYELEGSCVPALDIGSRLESQGVILQVYKGGTWGYCTSSSPVMIPAANVSGKVAAMRYRAYIPASYLNTASTLQQHMDARYLVAENQYQTLATVDASTRFGYKATLRSSSPKATCTLSAENAAAGWTDTSDSEQNICIETAATNKNARYVVRGTAEFLKNFAGLYDDETGAAVGRITSTTANSITGIFPVTKTGSYTLRFTTATISVAETNKNQTYMLNKNTITVHDTESHPTLNITLECAAEDGIFLRNAAYNSTELAWNGTEESNKLIYTQATSLGSLSIPAVFVPLRSGAISYTITVSDTEGAVLATKSVTNTVVKKNCTWTIRFGEGSSCSFTIHPSKESWIYSNYYEDYHLSLKCWTSDKLDYVGNGFELSVSLLFDFHVNMTGSSWGYSSDSDDNNPQKPNNVGGTLLNDLKTTLTVFFKNSNQEIRVYPIKNGWGGKYANRPSWSFTITYLTDPFYGRAPYNWGYLIDDGIEGFPREHVVQVKGDPQLNLTIK